MGKEEPITCTKVVQPLFTIRCQNESVLRAFTVTHGQDLAVSAIAGQSVRLGLPERDLVSAFQQINERRTLDIPEKMRGINEMIAGKEISVMFNDRNIPTVLPEYAELMLPVQCRIGGFLKYLHFDSPDILALPLIKYSTEKPTKLFPRHRVSGHNLL